MVKSKKQSLSKEEKEAVLLMRYHTVSPTYTSPTFASMKRIGAILNLKYHKVAAACRRTQAKPTHPSR